QYESVVSAVVQHADRVILCTIYEVQLEPPAFAKRVRVPLALLNNRILRTAARLGLDTLELRSTCTEPADFRSTDRAIAAGCREDSEGHRCGCERERGAILWQRVCCLTSA